MGWLYWDKEDKWTGYAGTGYQSEQTASGEMHPGWVFGSCGVSESTLFSEGLSDWFK